MQTSRTRDRDYLRAALVGACALLAALAVLIFKQAADVRDLNARLSAVYQKAFYETCELMEGMSTNLRKLLVTGSAQQEQMLLSEIARQAQGAQDDLSQLPLGEERGVGDDQVRQPGRGLRHFAGREVWRAARPSATRTMKTSPRSRRAAGELSARLGQLLARYESGEDVFAGDMGETGRRASTRSPTRRSPIRRFCTTAPSPTPPGRRNTAPLPACPMWTRPGRSGRCAPSSARRR